MLLTHGVPLVIPAPSVSDEELAVQQAVTLHLEGA